MKLNVKEVFLIIFSQGLGLNRFTLILLFSLQINIQNIDYIRLILILFIFN